MSSSPTRNSYPLRALVFPGVLACAVGAGALALAHGVPSSQATPVVVLASGAVVLLLQRWMPFRADWARWGPDLRPDLGHAVLSNAMGGAVWKLVLLLAVLPLAGWIAAQGGVWPAQWPQVLQLLLALVLADLGFYWFHRTFHRVPLLWRVHAVHHSAERLHMFSGARSHPLNILAATTAQFSLPLLLGAGEPVMALLGLFITVNGMLQHANIDMATGPLNQLMATAPVHRVHHSTDLVEGNSNFSSNLLLWDRVFGTYIAPEPEGFSKDVGLTAPRMANRWWDQLLAPFVWRRLGD